MSVLAIENCLIQKLPDLLSLDRVCDLTDVEVHSIAGESSESVAERLRTTQKLQVLESGLVELSRLKNLSSSTLGSQVCVPLILSESLNDL